MLTTSAEKETKRRDGLDRFHDENGIDLLEVGSCMVFHYEIEVAVDLVAATPQRSGEPG